MLQMSCDEADPVGVVVAESQFSQHDLITVDPFEIRRNHHVEKDRVSDDDVKIFRFKDIFALFLFVSIV